MVIAILDKADYSTDHTAGSRYVVRHPDYFHHIPIPQHAKDIKEAILRSVAIRSRLSKEEFLSLRP